MRRFFVFLLIVAMLTGGFVLAEEATAAHAPVVVLYTNDVHCNIDANIGYAGLAAYEEAYEKLGYEVILADVGDAIQGAPVGTLSKGEYIIDIMNEVGYDVAAIGNHEFDYGMDQFMYLQEKAAFPYVSANFCDMEGNTVVDGYAILQAGGADIAFVGVTTPQAYTKSSPGYFMNEQGEVIYNFSQGDDGKKLSSAVQKAVDAAVAEGADYVVLLTHLGIDPLTAPYMIYELIANITGVDVVLDAHTHVVIEQEMLVDAAGEEVLLTSAGTKLAQVGALVLAGDGSFTTRMHTETIFQDDDTTAFIRSIQAQYETKLNEVVAHTDVDLIVDDPETGARLVRLRDTNLSDLCADAYRAATGAEVAIVNGGGIRAGIAAGEITYGDILGVHPFGNMLCMVEATGQEILDALEVGVMDFPGEDGSFQHVSGMSYEVDTSIPTSVVLDANDMFVEVAGQRRVQNVQVNGEPIDLERTYTLAGHNHTLKQGGGGFNMFLDNTFLQDETMLDNQVLINYIVDELGGVVGEEYAEPYGQGRIVVK